MHKTPTNDPATILANDLPILFFLKINELVLHNFLIRLHHSHMAIFLMPKAVVIVFIQHHIQGIIIRF